MQKCLKLVSVGFHEIVEKKHEIRLLLSCSKTDLRIVMSLWIKDKLCHRRNYIKCICHRLNCDDCLGDVLGSVLMCIFNVDLYI